MPQTKIRPRELHEELEQEAQQLRVLIFPVLAFQTGPGPSLLAHKHGRREG